MLDPAVDVLAELAGDGPVLEFAIGTGRVAIPLTDRGVAVTGIELSEPMVEELQRTRSEIPVVVGDMATTTVPGDDDDIATQRGTSHHYRRGDDGTVSYGASNVRYVWPAECDLMAQLAGCTFRREWLTGRAIRSPATARATSRPGASRPEMTTAPAAERLRQSR